MKPDNFEQIFETYLHKTYTYENYIIHNNITNIQFNENVLSFLCEGITLFTMRADPVFTIQKLNKDIEQAIDAVDEEFLLFEYKNSSVDMIYNYCESHNDQFTDIFKTPYKFNDDTFVFTSAMIMSVTNCDAIVTIEYDGYSLAFAATNMQNQSNFTEVYVEKQSSDTNSNQAVASEKNSSSESEIENISDQSLTDNS